MSSPGWSHSLIDLHWDDKAVCAVLVGKVEMLDEASLRDKRCWSIQATRENDPDHVISAR